MKNLYFILILMVASASTSYAQLWSENFNSYADGTQVGANNNTANGADDWTVACPGCDAADKYAKYTPTIIFIPIGEVFLVSSDDVVTWTSEAIDISGTGKAVIELEAWSYQTEADDYMRCYYNVDGGGNNLFFEVNEEDGTLADNPGSAIISGNSVVIVVEFLNDGGGLTNDFWSQDIPNDDGFGINDLTVTAITDLYSASSGDWSTAANWETSPGAADAAGPPTSTIYAHIETGDAITTSADVIAAALEIQGTGSLSVNGSFDLEINYGSTLSVETGATLTTNNAGSTLSLLSEAYYTLEIDGSLTIGDINITDNQNVTINGGGVITVQDDLLIDANAQIANNITSLTIQDRLQFVAGSDGAVLTNNGTIDITDDLFFTNDNCSVINNGTISIGDALQVQAAADDGNSITNNSMLSFVNLNLGNGDFTLNNSGTITQSGDFSNNRIGTGSDFNNLNGSSWNWSGTIRDADVPTILDCTPSNNTFNYSNAGNQNIMITAYNSLAISGSGTKTLDGSTTVANTLTLTAGFVSLGANNLTLGNSASVSGGSSSSFVIIDGTGEFIQNNLGSGGRTGDISYPVGISSASYTPLIINNTTGTSDNFGVIVAADALDEGTTGNVQATAVIDRTWFITEAVAGGSDATITFQWNTSNELTSFDRTNLNIVHYDGTDWQVLGNTSASGSNPWTASISGVNSFSPFAIEDGMLAPLPVELVYFRAQLVENDVELSWQTASELNNDYFTIEKTTDLINFETVTVVNGQGTSNELTTYHFVDKFPGKGVSYYRLKQTDFDGTSTYSEVVRILNNETESISPLLKIYPNPNNGSSIALEFDGLIANEMVLINLYNSQGQLIHSSNIFANDSGSAITEWTLNNNISAGVYKVNALGTTSNKSFLGSLLIE